MNLISVIIIPIFVLGIILYGFKKKINIYDTFLDGAKEGLITTFNIFPAVLAMVFAINIFLDSNVLLFLLSFLNPILELFDIPLDIIPMALLRPISGTASLAIMNDIFSTLGPDSFAGRLASVLQGCTDTTVYVLALYYGSIKVTKIGHSLSAGLFADLVGIVAAFVLTSLFF